MGIYDVYSKQDVLSVKVCVFIEKTLNDYTTNTINKETALRLLTSVWNIVAGFIDQETVKIYDLAYQEINK
jgi:hypothetical protein